MFARVLLTNGSKTIKLYWLEHNGKDVVHGQPGSSDHMTYHASGQIHTKTEAGQYTDVTMHTPLNDIKGTHALMTVSFQNSLSRFDSQALEHLYYHPHKAKSKTHAILMIDCRTIPVGTTVNVSIGLVEPGNLAALGRYLLVDEDTAITIPKQVLIDTSVKPWVSAIVRWWHPDGDERFDALHALNTAG